VLGGTIAALLALVVLGRFVRPDPRGYGTHEQLGLPSCKVIEWWGIPCPGCGVTTSVAWAARGSFLRSLATQPFGLFVALAIPLAAVWAIQGHLRGRDLWRDLNAMRWGAWGWWIAVALLASWLYKIAAVRSLLTWR